MTPKKTAIQAMREVLAAATTPHDCHTMATKLRKKGLYFTGEQLYPWLCVLVSVGEASSRHAPDGKHETMVVFEKILTVEEEAMRGGKRDGAGRPALPASTKKTGIFVKLPPWLIRWMDGQKVTKNRAVLIEEALCKVHKLKPPEGDND
jgi:hypothetical protein